MTAQNRPVAIWLSATTIVILLMIMVGGITRLTDSGLSMVEWKPLLGAIPPMSEDAWAEKFEQYKKFPEYIMQKSHLNLQEFKFIFFWEYFHRLLGRFIGVIYFIPFIFFMFKGNLTVNLKIKLAIGFILGGLQGLLGWYMVKSGLVDRPDVSHYRLAAHFGLALFIIGYLFWIFLEVTDQKSDERKSDRLVTYFCFGFIFLLGIQIIYGAFVAGLDAGIGYNTFPKMNGSWIPKQILFLKPAWINFLENPAALQFTHRTIGWILLFLGSGLLYFARTADLHPSQRTAIYFIGIVVAVQFALGVATILLKVPLSFASMHQMGACILLLVSLRALFLMISTRKNSTI